MELISLPVLGASQAAISVQTWPSPRTMSCTTSLENVTETTSKYLDHKDMNFLRRMEPEFLRSMHFAKNTIRKAWRSCRPTTPRPWVACWCHQGPRKAQGDQAQDLKGRQLQAQSTAHIEQPKLGKHAGACIAKGSRLCWPQSKVKAQTKAQAAAVVMALDLSAASTPAPGQA